MALHGHLTLVCGLDDRGRSSLRRQSFRAPMHISKPHLDEGGALVVNVVNPTAGLLADDVIDCDVRVEAGAQLLLTSPSANRAHRAKQGWAELRQEFHVAAGGFLDVWPELFIPQGGAEYRQRSVLRVERGGELLYFESLAPGRVASGEAFAYGSLSWEIDLYVAEDYVARERCRLDPTDESVQTLRGAFPTAYYASALLVSDRLKPESPCWERLHDAHEEQAWIGCSRLAAGAWSVKAVAATSVLLRSKLALVRSEIYRELGRPEPGLRRVAGVG